MRYYPVCRGLCNNNLKIYPETWPLHFVARRYAGEYSCLYFCYCKYIHVDPVIVGCVIVISSVLNLYRSNITKNHPFILFISDKIVDIFNVSNIYNTTFNKWEKCHIIIKCALLISLVISFEIYKAFN